MMPHSVQKLNLISSFLKIVTTEKVPFMIPGIHRRFSSVLHNFSGSALDWAFIDYRFMQTCQQPR